MKLKVKKLHKDAKLPKYQTQWASGFDLASVEEISIPANERRIIPTGLAFEVPPGFEMQIRPRSGISAKTSLSVFFGTLDSDYRQGAGLIVHNTGDTYVVIRKGERIAQGVVAPVLQVEIEEVETLSETTRLGGFGSSGTM